MHYLAEQRIQARLAQEEGAAFQPGAGRRIGLVYPNYYFFGMSNLGFQTMYRLFNQEGRSGCERFFLPEEDLWSKQGFGSLRSYELKSSAGDMDLLAFSISYQNDYLNVIPLLSLMGLPWRARERGEEVPLVIAGGPAITINPEPVAELFDAMVIGEGEEVAGDILQVLQGAQGKGEILQALSELPGVYVPSHFENAYQKLLTPQKATAGFGLISGRANGTLQDYPMIQRLVVKDPQRGLAQSELLTRDTEFGDMYLIEVQRGCQWGCRFCAAGFMYRYPRYDSLTGLQRRIQTGLRYRDKVGLIAGDLLGHDAIHEILDFIDSQGGRFSPSSVRLNAFTPQIISHLKKSDNKTIAIAPEAGSERLRQSLNKTFRNEEIIESAVRLAEGGIHNIKLYIMIGIPGEQEVDIQELCDLTLKTRAALTHFAKRSGKMPSLTLSLSPFVPKPSTPLQYEVFAGMAYLKKVFRRIQREVLSHGHIRLSGESALDAYVETLLSRGDRRVVEFLSRATRSVGKLQLPAPKGAWRSALRDLPFDPQDFVDRAWPQEKPTPWDFIDHGIKNSFIQRELNKFSRNKTTHYCMPEVCRSCGVC